MWHSSSDIAWTLVAAVFVIMAIGYFIHRKHEARPLRQEWLDDYKQTNAPASPIPEAPLKSQKSGAGWRVSMTAEERWASVVFCLILIPVSLLFAANNHSTTAYGVAAIFFFLLLVALIAKTRPPRTKRNGSLPVSTQPLRKEGPIRVTIDHKQQRVDKHKTLYGNLVETRDVFSVIVRVDLPEKGYRILNKLNLWDYALFDLPNSDYEDENEAYELAHTIWVKQQEFGALSRWLSGYEPFSPSRKYQITIRAFCHPQGFTQAFDTPGEAKIFADGLRTHIKKLKDIIDYNEMPGQRETFEL